MQAWQTIESAPLDGREILITDGQGIEIAVWIEDEGGCWLSNEWSNIDKPTHWMPLPDLPSLLQTPRHVKILQGVDNCEHIWGAQGTDLNGKGYFICVKCGEEKPFTDGVPLKSAEHPPGLIDEIAEHIRNGDLPLKK